MEELCMFKKLFSKKSLQSNLSKDTVQINGDEKIPSHIAIIMDGNGRWAKKRSLPRIAGHREGMKNVRKITHYSADSSPSPSVAAAAAEARVARTLQTTTSLGVTISKLSYFRPSTLTALPRPRLEISMSIVSGRFV